MNPRLAIIGGGGHGREAVTVAQAIDAPQGRWSDIVVVDDGTPDLGLLERLGVASVGSIDGLNADETSTEHVIAIGDPAIRRTIAGRVQRSIAATTLVHPTASIGADVDLADGVLVYPQAVCTTNVRVGVHSHLNCGVVVSHDCRVGDFVSLSPGVLLNGAVTVGDGAFLGSGAVVLPGRTVGQDAIVGAGAVVVDDVAPGATVIGVPAR